MKFVEYNDFCTLHTDLHYFCTASHFKNCDNITIEIEIV